MSKVQELGPNLPDGKAGLFRDLVLLIAGEDFGERGNLQKLIDKLELQEKVFLIGTIEGKAKIEFLRNADVFALASHHENFGIVYAEALAAGTPVVASKNTPWQDVKKYNCGLCVENTPDVFAEAINEILKSDPKQMGKNGSKYIAENFSWDKISNQFNEVIKAII
jgi:glycosyltransferase involved in cell wall biosynthesis